MFKLLMFCFLFCLSQFAIGQATLIHYLRNWEKTADSIIQSHFDSCFYTKSITMDIKDAQIVHSEGRFKRWNDLVDSNKIASYRYYYIIQYGNTENLSTQITIELNTEGEPIHPRFNQPIKLYKDRDCNLVSYSTIINAAKDDKLKGKPEDWTVFFYFNSPWNDYARKAGFELHIFRFHGGKTGKKRYQGHIYDLTTGGLIAKTGGRYTFPLDY